MKALHLVRAFCVAFVLFVIGAPFAYSGSVLPLPSVNGPSLGDPTTNIYTMMQQLQLNTTSNFTSFTTITVAAAQASATQMQFGYNFLTAAVAVTGAIAMPTAKPGADVVIANNTGVGVAIFGSTAPFTPGGQDYINNVIGNSLAAGGGPYRIGNGQTAECVVPQGGNWWCVTGN